MRIYLPESPSPSPPPSPPLRPATSSTSSRRGLGRSRRTKSEVHDLELDQSVASNASDRRGRRRTASITSGSRTHKHSASTSASEKTTQLPDQENSWEAEEFYTAVRLRQRRDPVDEYEERSKKYAYQTAHEHAVAKWRPVAELMASTSATSGTPSEDRLKDAQARSIDEVQHMLSAIELNRSNNKNSHHRRTSQQLNVLWNGIETVIREEEEAIQRELKRQEEERARARAAEEARIRKEKEEKEARDRAEALELEKKAKIEEAAKKRAQEENERRAKEEMEERERVERKAAEKAEAEKVKGFAPKSALEEWTGYREILKVLKTAIMPQVRGNKQDESMINKEYKKVWSQHRRQYTPKIGQVTNSQAEIDRIAQHIHETLSPNPPHPEVLYLALLSSLAKVLLLQAETEVTAKHSTAYPLARVVMKLVAMGHTRFPDVFLARLVGRTGGWAIGCGVPRFEGQTEEQYRKSLGHPDSSEETSTQFIDRIAGMITLYAAILQLHLPIDDPSLVPYPFQLPRLWTWLARILNDPHLLKDKAAPRLLYAVFETAGDRMYAAYGKQIVKIRRGLGRRCLADGEPGEVVGGPKEGKAVRMRLGLFLEKWEKEGKIEPAGRDVGP